MLEKISREVKPHGNGAHVLIPKNWLGQDVLVVRKKKLPVQERILNALSPHLKDIVGAFLFGSHARDEAREDSDIDLLLITSKPLSVKRSGFEVIAIPHDRIDQAYSIEPIFFSSAISEAIPFINSELLQSLKSGFTLKPKSLKAFIQTTREVVRYIEAQLEDDLDTEVPGSIAYPVILRLRSLFTAMGLLHGEHYSHSAFKDWLEEKAPSVDLDSVLKAYGCFKRTASAKSVKASDITVLLKILKEQIANHEKRETTTKRN